MTHLERIHEDRLEEWRQDEVTLALARDVREERRALTERLVGAAAGDAPLDQIRALGARVLAIDAFIGRLKTKGAGEHE